MGQPIPTACLHTWTAAKWGSFSLSKVQLFQDFALKSPNHFWGGRKIGLFEHRSSILATLCTAPKMQLDHSLKKKCPGPSSFFFGVTHVLRQLLLFSAATVLFGLIHWQPMKRCHLQIFAQTLAESKSEHRLSFFRYLDTLRRSEKGRKIGLKGRIFLSLAEQKIHQGGKNRTKRSHRQKHRPK